MWNGFSQWTISKKYKKSEDPSCSLRLTPEKHRGTRCPLVPQAPKDRYRVPPGTLPSFSSETIRLIFFCWSFNYFWGPYLRLTTQSDPWGPPARAGPGRPGPARAGVKRRTRSEENYSEVPKWNREDKEIDLTYSEKNNNLFADPDVGPQRYP